jgi:hypothetical protein
MDYLINELKEEGVFFSASPGADAGGKAENDAI